MGLLETVKGIFNKGKQPLHQPPEPPKKEESTISDAGIMPPPKVADFDDEIPELPDLELPEELSKEKPVSPSEPQPKSPVVPPPQRQATHTEAETPKVSVEPPPESGEENKDNIELEKIETLKLRHPEPVEHTPSLKETTFIKPGGHEFIRENAFSQIVQGLREINEFITNSPRFGTLTELDAEKQKATSLFQKELKGALNALDEIDRIAFHKG